LVRLGDRFELHAMGILQSCYNVFSLYYVRDIYPLVLNIGNDTFHATRKCSFQNISKIVVKLFAIFKVGFISREASFILGRTRLVHCIRYINVLAAFASFV
jgi:hypothetical protein